MNILYVTRTDPRKTSFGNEQRTNALWNTLKKHGTVYTLRIIGKNVETEQYIDGEHPICNYAPYHHVLLDSLSWRIIRITNIPYLPFYYSLHKRISDLFRGKVFDLVVVRYINSFAKYHLWHIAPALVDIDDHPAQLFDTLVYPRLPLYVRSVAKLLNRIQIRYVMSKMKGGWISNKEQLRICPSRIKYLPNMPLLPSSYYCSSEQKRWYLLTVGLMSYEPNCQGVNSFLLTIWPVFHRRYPDVEYMIGGRNAPKEMAEEWNKTPGVKYVGFIEDLEEAYSHCIATVVPVESGGGTCIKTLESLAYSRACLSTEFGARGMLIEGESPCGLLVYKTADEFIAHFESLRHNDFRTSIEKGASQFIRDCDFEQQYEKAVDAQIYQYKHEC